MQTAARRRMKKALQNIGVQIRFLAEKRHQRRKALAEDIVAVPIDNLRLVLQQGVQPALHLLRLIEEKGEKAHHLQYIAVIIGNLVAHEDPQRSLQIPFVKLRAVRIKQIQLLIKRQQTGGQIQIAVQFIARIIHIEN